MTGVGWVGRDQVMAAVRALGLDPERVVEVHLFPDHLITKTWTGIQERSVITTLYGVREVEGSDG